MFLKCFLLLEAYINNSFSLLSTIFLFRIFVYLNRFRAAVTAFFLDICSALSDIFTQISHLHSEFLFHLGMILQLVFEGLIKHFSHVLECISLNSHNRFKSLHCVSDDFSLEHKMIFRISREWKAGTFENFTEHSLKSIFKSLMPPVFFLSAYRPFIIWTHLYFDSISFSQCPSFVNAIFQTRRIDAPE